MFGARLLGTELFRTELLGTIVRLFVSQRLSCSNDVVWWPGLLGSDVRDSTDDDVGVFGTRLFDADVGLLGPDVWQSLVLPTRLGWTRLRRLRSGDGFRSRL